MAETEWMRLTAAELNERAAAGALVIVPVASLEQHGPHLATGVDIVCATAVAQRVARLLDAAGEAVVVTPCVWTGLAEHHVAFGGTVTLDYATFAAVLRGVVRSAARAGFKRVMLLNGHGGNAEAVAVAATELSVELGIAVAAGTYWHLAPEAIAPILDRQPGLMHACEAETSMMMVLMPEAVRREKLQEAHGPHSTRVEGQPSALARRRSFKELTPSGVIGDARTASAEKGEKLLAAVAERIAAILRNEALWQ
ncbi:MAG: creatininase family protein [Acetobacteraceae bacterium]|nr:creatininase family protein [Acetobacteraceae bacterium]